MTMNVCLQSLGCRLNWSEIQVMMRQLVDAGYVIVSDPTEADICIINTCAVTASAERKSRRCVRRLARANPESRIAIVGCCATLSPQDCADWPGVAWVVPNAEKDRVVEIVAASHPPPLDGKGKFIAPRRTRAFVKVQEGCDNYCTYCIVRLLRGSAHSFPLTGVIDEALRLVKAGYQEIVLTGVNLGSYGRDLGMQDGLYELIEALLIYTDLPRLRLSSLEPWDVDETFFALWKNPRLCRQLHLPLQSGCDETLRRMGRPITTREFACLVEAARSAIPGLAVTTDLMVGFPGEDEDAFRASYDFAAAMEFAKLHVFPYSPRPGTAAARLPNQVEDDVCEERVQTMCNLGAEQASRFRQRFIGEEVSVLWEHRRSDGSWPGWTDNYLRVVTRATEDLHNTLTSTRLIAAQNGHLIGQVIA